MNPLQFFAASRLVVLAGKGGVGKTTVTAVMARAAAEWGLSVLVVEVQGRRDLDRLLGGEATIDDDIHNNQVQQLLSGLGADGNGRVDLYHLTSEYALVEYLDDHGFRRISKRLASSGILSVVSTAAPGMGDLLILGKVKQLERAGTYDLIVLDGPAAGHAISFLQSASGLLDAATVGPIQAQAKDVVQMLTDPRRCQVMLVTLPESTPVSEVIETAFALEDRVGVALGPVIVDAVDDGPPLDEAIAADLGQARLDAARFRNRRRDGQRQALDRLADQLPLPLLRLPQVLTATLEYADIVDLSRRLLAAIEALP
jgi:cellulose biosynthesis protein BcsQ